MRVYLNNMGPYQSQPTSILLTGSKAGFEVLHHDEVFFSCGRTPNRGAIERERASHFEGSARLGAVPNTVKDPCAVENREQ